MSKLAIVMVEGDNATVQEALRAGFALIERANGHAEPALPNIAQIASEISASNVSSAVEKVRRAVKKSAGSKNKPGKFPCRVDPCERVLGSAQARGKHESAEHGAKKAAAVDAVSEETGKPAEKKRLPCGMNGCLETFGNYYYRSQHWRDVHGKVN